MKAAFRAVLVAAALAVVLAACAKVPYTGRRQFNLIPEAIMNGMGKATYADMLSSVRVEKAGGDVTVLKKVGGRISKAAAEPDYAWKFALIDESTINAWCLPGGYIGFYSGILPVLKNEAGMAFVMGHEVGHATAHHGAERISQQLAVLGGLAGLNAYLAGQSKLTDKQRTIVIGALGVGAQLGILLPFSRQHESEADVIGMMYMSGVGYPPGESIKLWDRMEKETGPSVPAFISTHPSNEQRQAKLREWMPNAKKRYERHKLAYDTQDALW